MLEHAELGVDNSITIQCMASTFMLKRKCFNGVYHLSVAIQQFIIKCVVGGSVMTANTKQFHVKMKIAGFGACSLYLKRIWFLKISWYLKINGIPEN